MNNINPEKAKGSAVAPANPLKTGQSGRNHSLNSTATEAQRERILQALRRRPQTSYDLRCLGCYPAARVKELRDRFGYVITTDRVTLHDRDGYGHARCALYSLISEPAAV